MKLLFTSIFILSVAVAESEPHFVSYGMRIVPENQLVNGRPASVICVREKHGAILKVVFTLPVVSEEQVSFSDAAVVVTDGDGRKETLHPLSKSLNYMKFVGAGPILAVGYYRSNREVLKSTSTLELSWKGSVGVFRVGPTP